MKEKPDVNKHMLMSIETEKGANNIVLPLADIHMTNIVKVDLDISIKKISNPNIIFTITNDPLLTTAQDWSNLGCFRIRLVFEKCKILDTKGHLSFIPQKANIQINFPQRTLYDVSRRIKLPAPKESQSLLFNKDLKNGITFYIDGKNHYVNPETMYQGAK